MPTHREQMLKKLGLPEDTSLNIEEIAAVTGTPLKALKEIWRRAIGAWKTNPQSIRIEATGRKSKTAPRTAKMSKERWAYGRLWSFLNKGVTYHTADADIARRYGL